MSVAHDLDRWSTDAAPARGAVPLSAERALANLEDVMSRPVDSGSWWAALAQALDALVGAMWEERTEVAGPSGLHHDILGEQPRLAFALQRLEHEETELLAELAGLRTLVGACIGRAGGIAVALTSATDLVGRLRDHHDREDAVMHEAFQCDLGGGD